MKDKDTHREIKVFASDAFELMTLVNSHIVSLQNKLSKTKRRKDLKNLKNEIENWKAVNARITHSYCRSIIKKIDEMN